MIDRFIYLYPAIECSFRKLDDDDLQAPSARVLATAWDIRQMLEVPHAAQELLSSERTPTLSFSIPAYEELILQWKRLSKTLPNLSHFIDVGIRKLKEYLGHTQKTRIYVHAMVVNPSMKFSWIEQNRPAAEVAEAREWIKSSMLKFQQELRQNGQLNGQASLAQLNQTTAAGQASQAVNSGYERLRNLNTGVRRYASFTSSTSARSSTPTPQVENLDENTSAEHGLEEDIAIVEAELKKYELAGINQQCYQTSHIIRTWERDELESPLLFRVAMDILPVQASAVPCERVFSSSKETSTLRRARSTPDLMEALQVLKFSYKQDKLNFMDYWGVSKEDNYTISGTVTDIAVQELIKANDWETLEDLLANEGSATEEEETSDD